MAADDIPFDRAIDAKADQVVRLSPLVRRLIANNGGPFTFTGTCTYLVGDRDITVIDPGPADPMHRQAILEAAGAGRIGRIVVTHSHKDHAPGAAALKAATGAPIIGCAPYKAQPAFGSVTTDASHDAAYRPDTVLADGATIDAADHRLVTVATPGHTANHLAFALEPEGGLFSGDHVMAWSTTVVAPPDGSMRDYMASLERLQARADVVYWPGHGGPVRNPQRFVRALASHRRQREQAILGRLAAGDRTVQAIVGAIYDNLPAALKGAAGASVLAHLIALVEQGAVLVEGSPSLAATFRPSVEPARHPEFRLRRQRTGCTPVQPVVALRMRYLFAFVLLTGFAALNLVLNFYAPPGIKLLLVPAFSVVLIVAIGGLFRRQRNGKSPPP